MTEQVDTQVSPEQTGAAAPQAPAADAAGQAGNGTAQPEQMPSGQAAETGNTQQDTRNSDGYIRRLQAQRARERERAKRLEAENAELKARMMPQQPAGPPDPQQYQDYNEYVRNAAAYEARREAQAIIQAQHQAAAEAQARAAAARLESEFEARADKARAQYPDYDEAVAFLDESGALDQLKPVLLHAGDAGPDILRYLGKNPSELDRIATLPPVEQVRAVWALADRAKPQPRQTQAPKPIEPVQSTGSNDLTYRPGMKQDDYAKWRAKRQGRTT